MSTIENLPEEKAAPPVENRVGQFKIHAALLRNEKLGGWKQFLPLFAHMVIIRAEFIYATDMIEYTAQSDLFEVSELNCAPPEYDIIGNTKPDGSVEYTAKKILSLADFQLKKS